MGEIGIKLCDYCGKRTDTFAGKLVLSSYKKKGDRYDTYSPRVSRSWALCKTCLSKLTNVVTIGDKIKEEIEMKIDEIKLNHNKLPSGVALLE